MATGLKFGVFEVDLEARELRRRGLRLRLPSQSFEILALLVQRPGEIVSRERIRQRLWPEGTVVEFEHSVNAAVNRLREVLGDEAASARFIETIPRRGYRFVAHVEAIGAASGGRRAARWAALAAVLLLAAAIGGRPRKPDGGRIQSIAVLPFVDLSPGNQDEYLADGITEELIAGLSQIQALRLTSRGSSMRYRKTTKPIPEIGRELGVDAVMEGTVQRFQDRVRVTVKLIEVAGDRHLLAESFERHLKDLLSLRVEIAHAVVNEVRVRITPQELARLSRLRPVRPEAYEAYLRGRYIVERGGRAGPVKAVEYFRRAVELDPNFALGWAELSMNLYQLLQRQDLPITEEVRAQVRRALELDPQLAEAHTNLGDIEFFWNWNWEPGLAEFRRAVELDPGSLNARVHLAYGLFLLGRHAESLTHMERAAVIDPLSPVVGSTLGEWLRLTGQPERALERLRLITDINPNHALCWRRLGLVSENLGRTEAAVEAHMKAEELGGRTAGELQVLRQRFLKDGIRAAYLQQAQVRLPKLLERAKRERVPPKHLASAYAQVQDREQALHWLEEAYRQRSPTMHDLAINTDWDCLRADPRFQDLMRRLKLRP